MSAEEKRRLFIEKVHATFPIEPIPSEYELVFDRSYVDVHDMWKNLRGKKWTELPIETLAYHRDEISFLTETAFLYYYPAFLAATLEHPIKSDTLIDNLVNEMLPHEMYGGQDFYGNRYRNGFTREQLTVILEYLNTIPELLLGQGWSYEDLQMELKEAIRFIESILQNKDL